MPVISPPGESQGDLYATLDALYAFVRREVAAGFLPADQIASLAHEVFQDDLDPAVLRHHAQRYTRELLEEHAAEQAGWPDVTDNDRLDRAFAALERQGIVSRQHFSCCGTCGAAEIWDEMEAEKEEAGRLKAERFSLQPSSFALHPSPIGYVFFHRQDTESAVEDGGTYLSYGAVAEGSHAAEAVGHAVVAALVDAGLTTVWDGHWSRRIFVSLVWRRRRG